MTPAARVAASIDVLTELEASGAPAERVVAAWGRAHRYAGARDRAAIADMVFDCLRRRRSLAWRLQDDAPRAAVLAAVALGGADPEAVFTGQGYAPPALTAAERAALAATPPPAPDPVRLDYPDWLDAPLRAGLGTDFEASMLALRERAPVDLRVNALKADAAAATAALAAEGVAVAAGPHAPLCLRAAPGAPVARTRAYLDGLVELQDAASQAVADFAAARAGETVLDFCAGGGGKTLALAAAMAGSGRLIAYDAAPRRMRDLPGRLARAGARAQIAEAGELRALSGACDLVLVDAPCSGSGAWRRDPAGKWRLSPARLAEALAAQAAALTQAALLVRPGGRLVYATCSVLRAENDEQVAAWLQAAPDAVLRLTPAQGADGFFAARAGRPWR